LRGGRFKKNGRLDPEAFLSRGASRLLKKKVSPYKSGRQVAMQRYSSNLGEKK